MKNFSFVLKYAVRNLKRNPGRTMKILLGIAISTALMMWVLNLTRSSTETAIINVTAEYVGKITGHHPELSMTEAQFKVYKFMHGTLPPNIEAKSSKRVLSPVFISGEKKTVGAMMAGFDPIQEAKITRFKSRLTSGTFLTGSSHPRPLLLGEKLAKKLELKLGDEVVVLGQAIDGSMANDLFQVAGLFNWGGGTQEEKMIFTTIKANQDFLSMPADSYHTVITMDESLQSEMEKSGLTVTSWTKIIPDAFVSFDFLNKINFFLTCILLLVVSVGITNTLLVSFFERRNEFKSLNIIGASNKWIAISLLLEVYALLIISLVLALILAFLVVSFFTTHAIDLRIFTGNKQMMVGGMSVNPFVYVQHFGMNYLVSVGMSLFMVSLAMLYPVKRTLNPE